MSRPFFTGSHTFQRRDHISTHNRLDIKHFIFVSFEYVLLFRIGVSRDDTMLARDVCANRSFQCVCGAYANPLECSTCFIRIIGPQSFFFSLPRSRFPSIFERSRCETLHLRCILTKICVIIINPQWQSTVAHPTKYARKPNKKKMTMGMVF